MNNKLLFCVVYLLFGIFCYAQKQEKQHYTLSIQVFDTSSTAIAYGSVNITDLNLQVPLDAKGRMVIKLPKAEYNLEISALGYELKTRKVLVNGFTNEKFYLKAQSVELPEFIIMAKYQNKSSDKAVITQSALSYIQPTSITDALVLLPGSVYNSASMNKFSTVSLRQSGSDKNTSLGVSIVSQGVSMNNDGMRNQLYGLTGSSVMANSKERNLVFNSGMDMRMISTDHLESITVEKGISSAKQGNLSSAQISLNAKQGKTPLQIRAKVDPNIQLLYMGKGIGLGHKLGVLHAGVDILSAKPDVRETLMKFTRITSQLNHNLKVNLLGESVSLNTKFNHTSGIDNHKSDQSTILNQERYKVTYHKYDITFKASSLIGKSWADKIELIAHMDYTKDLLDRRLMVYTDTGVNMSNSTESGVHQGFYLPSKYMTSYKMDNKPLNIFGQLNASKFLSFGENVSQNIIYGLEYNSAKNYGKGAIIDPNLPPFPMDNTFIRPRENSSIPALIHTAYYLESDLSWYLNNIDSKIKLVTGVRASQLFNLPENYLLNKKLLFEPRLSLSFQTDYSSDLSSSIRFGFGQQNKFPTLDYLYPDRIYKDVEVLNWYANDPKDRLLLTHTFISDVDNANLKASKTSKYELAMNWYYKGYGLSLTAFKEENSNGFDYHNTYRPINYQRFVKKDVPIASKPTLEDFYPVDQHNFIELPRVENSKKVVKKGIEYRITFPEIESINTSVEINGAYYRTLYSSNKGKMYFPKTLISNDFYKYVGLYDNASGIIQSRFNTNVWVNTRIPKLKMIFTTFFQSIWYSSSRRSSNESFIPSSYIDQYANQTFIDYSKAVIDNPELAALDLREESANFSKNKTGPDFMINLKGTKEFDSFGSVSFFVNNIINLNTKSKNNYNLNQRKWSSAYFGFEVTLKLDK
ncbi:TonB-dependent receptor plug domain-containing protein [Myroides pelagicus]|uniref:TonB-dependent receptor plug domain-containing protein n=1 Tax=Myroides pelagicus TaxID=270914 RepID=A0A7K1GNN9_9FLAO|nr:TonB-dependent receptor plug domain-containing protein [Myroides pelagicus]MTH30505.1 TonB-dependent receptor plug domain-containing protein [Myroides pelagicus]